MNWIEELLYDYPTLPKKICDKKTELLLYTRHKNDFFEGAKISNKENSSVKFIVEGIKTDPTHDAYMTYEKLIDRVKKDIDKLEQDKLLVEKWMQTGEQAILTAQERLIIELRYFKRCSWFAVSIKANYNERWCKQINKNLLQKIKKHFNTAPNSTLLDLYYT